MTLTFTKKEGKKHVINYHRDHGTSTWMPADDFMVMHNLSHFAIEKKLGYTTAFYGMINSGVELSDFLNKQKREAMTVTNEATHAGSMANLFSMEIWQRNVAGFNQVLQELLRTSAPAVQPLFLAGEQIAAVQNYLADRLPQWKERKPDQSLQLGIPL